VCKAARLGVADGGEDDFFGLPLRRRWSGEIWGGFGVGWRVGVEPWRWAVLGEVRLAPLDLSAPGD